MTITAPILSEPAVTPAPSDDQARLRALAATLEDRSVRLGELAAESDVLPGVARRVSKLARQHQAAARLLRRGDRLAVPGSLLRLERLAAAPLPSPSLGTIDGAVAAWRTLLVALHVWRGHRRSVPVKAATT